MIADEQAALHEIIRAELPDPQLPLEPEVVIRELGIDSMKVLRIITRIERHFDVELDDEVVFGVATLGDLIRALDAARTERAVGP